MTSFEVFLDLTADTNTNTNTNIALPPPPVLKQKIPVDCNKVEFEADLVVPTEFDIIIPVHDGLSFLEGQAVGAVKPPLDQNRRTGSKLFLPFYLLFPSRLQQP